MTPYYNLHLSNHEVLSVNQPTFRVIEAAINARSNEMIRVGDMLFPARSVLFVKKITGSPYADVPEVIRPHISEEQRRDNLNRMDVIRSIFFARQRPRPEDWINPYEATDPRGTMTRAELRAFHKEFFDVDFGSDERAQAAAGRWLTYQRGLRDPRTYRREECLA